MLLLATESGQLINYNDTSGNSELLFSSTAKKAVMGIAESKGFIYLASLDKIYKIDKKTWLQVSVTTSYKPSPDFHQMEIYGEKLYTTITKQNQIWVFDLNLKLLNIYDIEAPYPGKKVAYKKNYNHINSIVKRANKFYVNLNWLTSTPYAASGVAVLDEEFKLINKFEFGWEAHDFQFMGDKMIAICASSNKKKKIIHPYRAGLMVNNELVFEHDPDMDFCKGLTFNDDYIYLCGGKKETRRFRRNTNAVIYKLDRHDYSLIERLEFENIRAIKGCLLTD